MREEEPGLGMTRDCRLQIFADGISAALGGGTGPEVIRLAHVPVTALCDAVRKIRKLPDAGDRGGTSPLQEGNMHHEMDAGKGEASSQGIAKSGRRGPESDQHSALSAK